MEVGSAELGERGNEARRQGLPQHSPRSHVSEALVLPPLARGYCCSVVLEHCRVRWLQAGVLNHSFLVEVGLPWWLRWERMRAKQCVKPGLGIPRLERAPSPGRQPTPYFCLKDSTDREACGLQRVGQND